MVNSTILEDLQTRYNKVIRTVPQVVIKDNLIGGYDEVEAIMANINWKSKKQI